MGKYIRYFLETFFVYLGVIGFGNVLNGSHLPINASDIATGLLLAIAIPFAARVSKPPAPEQPEDKPEAHQSDSP